jgi:hypothetical protein
MCTFLLVLRHFHCLTVRRKNVKIIGFLIHVNYCSRWTGVYATNQAELKLSPGSFLVRKVKTIGSSYSELRNVIKPQVTFLAKNKQKNKKSPICILLLKFKYEFIMCLNQNNLRQSLSLGRKVRKINENTTKTWSFSTQKDRADRKFRDYINSYFTTA